MLNHAPKIFLEASTPQFSLRAIPRPLLFEADADFFSALRASASRHQGHPQAIRGSFPASPISPAETDVGRTAPNRRVEISGRPTSGTRGNATARALAASDRPGRDSEEWRGSSSISRPTAILFEEGNDVVLIVRKRLEVH